MTSVIRMLIYIQFFSLSIFGSNFFVTLILFVDFGLLQLVVCLCSVELLSGPLLICSSAFLRFTALLIQLPHYQQHLALGLLAFYYEARWQLAVFVYD